MLLIKERPPETKKIKLKMAMTVGNLLKIEKINPETVLVVKNDILVGNDELLVDSDTVKLLSVISGG
jgi:sulfur carrier protein ThiS